MKRYLQQMQPVVNILPYKKVIQIGVNLEKTGMYIYKCMYVAFILKWENVRPYLLNTVIQTKQWEDALEWMFASPQSSHAAAPAPRVRGGGRRGDLRSGVSEFMRRPQGSGVSMMGWISLWGEEGRPELSACHVRTLSAGCGEGLAGARPPRRPPDRSGFLPPGLWEPNVSLLSQLVHTAVS